jgi:hypothetical protein
MEKTYDEDTLAYLEAAGVQGELLERVKRLQRAPQHVLIAESMEPVIHWDLDPNDICKTIVREGDPEVSFRLVVDVETGKKWLDERLQALKWESLAVKVSDWTQGSVGHALPGYEKVGTTGASSIRRSVTYSNRYGTYKLWQQVKVEWIEGAK